MSAPVPASVRLWRNSVARQRIDVHKMADGMRVLLTVSLPNGAQFRFTGDCTYQEAARALRNNPSIGETYGLTQAEIGACAEVGFSLGGLIKGIGKGLSGAAKGLGKVAKGIANSKVFKIAGSALATAAPFLGPLAPAAIAAAGGMKAATALLAAKQHKKKGNTAAARQLATYAAGMAKKVSGIVPEQSTLAQAHRSANAQYALLLKPA